MSACQSLHHYVNIDIEKMKFDASCGKMLNDLRTQLVAEHLCALQQMWVASANCAAENTSCLQPPEDRETSESRPFFSSRPVSVRPEFAPGEPFSVNLFSDCPEEDELATIG